MIRSVNSRSTFPLESRISRASRALLATSVV